MGARTAVVWLRNDLRLADNPALAAAAASFTAVAPVFVWSPKDAGAWSPGRGSRMWLPASLKALSADIVARGGRLTVLNGPTAETLIGFVHATGADTVLWNRRYEPALAAHDAHVERALASAGIAVRTFAGSLLNEPEAILTRSGGAYQVFTPYYNAARTRPLEPPLPAPERLPAPAFVPMGISLRRPAGANPDVIAAFTPGEAGARLAADHFFEDVVRDYGEGRERPDSDGTSRLSPHLAFGEVSPRTLVARANEVVTCNGECHVAAGAIAFIRQLYWREFAYHVLRHHPNSPELPLRRQFDVFPWSRDPVALDAWQQGMTGFPIVDAGMRQLLATGWMHNRVRMLVASVLTKDLLLPWTEGAHWFWERLVDADLANNTFGWQWVAGTGADAAPYFRIFNPILQGERYDPDGAYVRRWVPELADLPSAWIHKPWKAPTGALLSAGVVLGDTYPLPIVDHAGARLRALAIHGSIRELDE